jgi:hypothetical protein
MVDGRALTIKGFIHNAVNPVQACIFEVPSEGREK